jgi:hypothetical protein
MVVLPGGGYTDDSDAADGVVFSTPALLGNMLEAAKAWGESKARIVARRAHRAQGCTHERVRQARGSR